MENSAMKNRMIILLVMVVSNSIAPLSLASDWQWRRIAWDDIYLSSVLCPPDSENVIYVSTQYWNLPEDELGVYKSIDSGSTWRFLADSQDPTSYALSMDPNDPNTIFCGVYTCIYEPSGRPWRSRDAGQSWERNTTNLSCYSKGPWDDSLMFAAHTFDASYCLKISINTGESWKVLCGSEVRSMSKRVIFHSVDSTAVYACIGPPTTPVWGLGRSTDRGENWEILLQGQEIPAFDQDPSDPSHWIAIKIIDNGDKAYFAESFNDGSTWELTEFPYDVWRIEQLLFDLFDSQIMYISQAAVNGDVIPVLRSVDGGLSWEPMIDGLSEIIDLCSAELFLLRSEPGQILNAAHDGLWLWSDSQSSDVAANGTPEMLRIRSISPCPFQDRMQARIEITKSGNVHGAIYSLDGSLVKPIFDAILPEGVHHLHWNGLDNRERPASPGSYILQIQHDLTKVSTQIVKLR